MNETARIGSKSIPLTDAERDARIELAACYRIFDMLGWTELIFNHITLRVPGPEKIFLINPFGLQYQEVTASNLVAVDIDGNPIRDGQHPINRAGFVTHSAIHGNLNEAHCVMHTHTTTGCAVAGLDEGLSHDSFYGAMLHGKVAYHEFEGITTNPEERTRMLQSIGDKQVVILRNHGLLTWGKNIAEAFLWLWTLQRACDIQIAGAPAGKTRQLGSKVFNQTTKEAGAGESIVVEMTYAALKRQIDASQPDYKN